MRQIHPVKTGLMAAFALNAEPWFVLTMVGSTNHEPSHISAKKPCFISPKLGLLFRCSCFMLLKRLGCITEQTMVKQGLWLQI